MPSGRPRKPTAELKLLGDYHPARHGDRSREPQPTGRPVKPPRLSRDASAHWDFIVPQLIETGVATAVDQPALVAMCQFFAEYHFAERKRTKDRKRLMMMVSAHREWLALASKFGLTPSDRARIVSESKDKARSKTASHLA